MTEMALFKAFHFIVYEWLLCYAQTLCYMYQNTELHGFFFKNIIHIPQLLNAKLKSRGNIYF